MLKICLPGHFIICTTADSNLLWFYISEVVYNNFLRVRTPFSINPTVSDYAKMGLVE